MEGAAASARLADTTGSGSKAAEGRSRWPLEVVVRGGRRVQGREGPGTALGEAAGMMGSEAVEEPVGAARGCKRTDEVHASLRKAGLPCSEAEAARGWGR